MSSIEFTINGQSYKVTADTVPIDTSLNHFIRNNAELHGTKFMCLEGGCGACLVTLKGVHPVTGETKTWATNSCLTPLYAVHGLDVITVEGIGNKKDGYHPVQSRLSNLNGTQCGYCSPGMVMNMYSLLEANGGQVTMAEVENSFGGNICRCTGYRPILDAFKSLAIDADEKLVAICQDIEDLTKTCPKTGSACAGLCHKSPVKPVSITFSDKKQWHKVFDVESVFKILNNNDKKYMFVAGNTAHGVYRRDRNIDIFIDVNGIRELHTHAFGNSLEIGANVSLTEAMDILTKASKTPGFEYCKDLSKHIDLIANVPVRNAGTIAGNLSIKHGNKEFPSDLFLILEGVGATLAIGTINGKPIYTSLENYLSIDMDKKILLKVTLPHLDAAIFKFRSYKIMPRAQNAHAYVNAAFLFKFNGKNKIENARICFGGINPNFVHAKKTETFFVGKELYDNAIIQQAIGILSNEISPDWILPDASPEYRKNLAIALFYKFILSTAGSSGLVKPEYISGGNIFERPLSSGNQQFDTYEDKWPLTKPVPKYEGLIQCSGEAKYMNDFPHIKDQLWAAFVQAHKVNAKIGNFDASEALKIPGVHHFYSAKDIPGQNNFLTPYVGLEAEEILVGVDSEIKFYGQPAGIILADTHELAHYAATKVKITYITDDKLIVPTMKDAFDLKPASGDRFKDTAFEKEAKAYGANTTHSISGRFEMGGQYHYTMEPQTTVCIPNETEMDVFCSTQWLDLVHIAIAHCIQVPENKINISIRRLGGGYGSKITRPGQIACACALACHLTNRPVRFVLSLEANMDIVGKRCATINEYKVDVDDNGKIQKLKNSYAQDFGCSMNDSAQMAVTPTFQNCYAADSWDVKSQAVITNAPSHTWCRAPGTTEGIAMIENIIEHIAFETGKDPVDVRLANLKTDSVLHNIIPTFLKDNDYYKRKSEIDAFNKANRWIKRGIAITPMKYPQEYMGGYPVFIAVYHGDGTVAISHSGIEMGQGINTKVAQVAATTLGIPLETVCIKPTDNLTSANGLFTGGSFTSELVCYATIKGCEEILERMKPVRDELKGASFAQIAAACFAKNIDLTSKYMVDSSKLKTYDTWGVSCAEIEVDCLTGNIQLRRVDILEDTGESMSPLVDVGQVEGAFIMGIGYWLCESIVHNRDTGELLTNRTWTYKPPGAKDIPIDFRVTFLQKSSNPAGVLRSKATGEPALCMSVVCIFALRYALNSARKDAGLPNEYFHLGAPSTPETIFLQAGNSIELFKL